MPNSPNIAPTTSAAIQIIVLFIFFCNYSPPSQGKATGRRALLGNGAGGESLYFKRKINVYIASLLRNMAPVGIGSIVLIEEVLDAGTESELV